MLDIYFDTSDPKFDSRVTDTIFSRDWSPSANQSIL